MDTLINPKTEILTLNKQDYVGFSYSLIVQVPSLKNAQIPKRFQLILKNIDIFIVNLAYVERDKTIWIPQNVLVTITNWSKRQLFRLKILEFIEKKIFIRVGVTHSILSHDLVTD